MQSNINISFKDLGLAEALLRAIADKGYLHPTAIQAQAIPAILSGSDILAGSQTGTGKTAGFTLPLLQLLKGRSSLPRALVLTPTRELAAQVEDSIRVYGKYLSLRSTVVVGGVSMGNQIRALKNGVDIIVATPGRLLDHVAQKTVDLSAIEILVLDEADRMLDMGFIHDIRRVLALLPKVRQNLLFSATFSEKIKTLASSFLNKPVLIQVTKQNTTAEGISQIIHLVDNKRKRALLSHLISSQDWSQVLVFTRTKHGANRLAQQLILDGITASVIHGNKSQSARTKALADFKQGSVKVLVATDIAARGLDIDQLPHVVNYELPNVPEDYVHRIGRTGRAGNKGAAVSLVCVDEAALLKDIERLLKITIPTHIISGYEPDPTIKPEPILNGRQNVGKRMDFGRRENPARASKETSSRERPSREGIARRGEKSQTAFLKKRDVSLNGRPAETNFSR